MNKKLNCILLVDDNESDNYFHKRIIRDMDIVNHVESVSNGKEAIDYLLDPNTESPDIIVLDVNMPVLDGVGFLREFKKLKIAKKIGIILMISEFFEPEKMLKAEEKVENLIFHDKPLKEEYIRNIINKYFS